MSFATVLWTGVLYVVRIFTLGFVKNFWVRLRFLGIFYFGAILMYDSVILAFKEKTIVPIFSTLGQMFIGVDLLIRQETTAYLTNPELFTALNLVGALFFFYFLHRLVFKVIKPNNSSAGMFNAFLAVAFIFLVQTGYGSASASAEAGELTLVVGYSGLVFFLSQLGNILNPAVDGLRMLNEGGIAFPELNSTNTPQIPINFSK